MVEIISYKEQLRRQKRFLLNSMHLFENFEEEAIRMATTIRVLVHDTTSSTSLLTHLDIKKSTQFYNTALPEGSFAGFNLNGVNVQVDWDDFIRNTPYAALVAKEIISVNGNIRMAFKPFAKNANRDVNEYPTQGFDDWWEGKVYDDKNGKEMTRKQLILAASNKDGGAHVDTVLPPNYVAIKNSNFVDIIVDGQQRDFDNVPLYSSIYQVGWELLQSLGACGA
jgi:hypothetical protein